MPRTTEERAVLDDSDDPITPEWRDRIMRSGASVLNEWLSDLLEGALQECGEWWDWPSPIEHAMAAAMSMLRQVRYEKFEFSRFGDHSEEKTAREYATAATTREPGYLLEQDRDDDMVGCVFPQVTIGAYCVDFLILHIEGLEGLGGVVVECDGHAFHDRTKEQAAHDKARDRFLQERGYKVLRFTGSEICRNAVGCADQALRIAHKIAWEAEYGRRIRDLTAFRASL
jgi:very-short-patch-repair endonuclease